ncbi:cyclase family protein [Calidithermus roseus]|uniref:Kynurenine formamidase n=1 Tax=Calidithermus roseus TaxID=1644118 RepID=A0A399ERP4_9DEIN|nr:cyclase family protein [Calidithermus roseus]RIH86200.1 Kynurenine formamidase [Calidithermus roseus]
MIDITRRLYEGHPVWPGDTPFTLEPVSKIADGNSVNVSKLTTTTHLGTHLDAPYHYVEDGGKLESVPLSVFIGPCQVVDARGQQALDVPFLRSLELRAERVLFYTGQPDEWRDFPREFTHVLPAAVDYLAERGVRLFGTDCPSVDPLTSKDLPGHKAFARNGIFIVEGLALEAVRPGEYELIVLPLRLEGADASPVRAILR